MRHRQLLIAVLASPFFLPVSCTSVMLPVAHGLSYARTHDVAAGEPLQHLPLQLPLVDRVAPNLAVAIDVGDLPAALQRWPGLTPRVHADGNAAGPGDDRLWWRVLARDGDSVLVEIVDKGHGFTHTVRYRATDDGVQLLSSQMYSDRDSWPGFAAGLLAAFALMFSMRRRRRRRPVA